VRELPSVEAYLDDKDTVLVALFRRFEELVARCGESSPA